MSDPQWSRGQRIVIRHVWRGAVRVAEPALVVEDSRERLVVFTPLGAPVQRSRIDFDLGVMHPIESHLWHTTSMVRILEPNVGFAITAMFWGNSGKFACWYIDFQEPFRRVDDGIVTWDQSLDIVAASDLSWQWKDEDEFARIQELGWLTPVNAEIVRQNGCEVIRRIEARMKPFNEKWPEWRPDPAWPIPSLPDNWAVVPRPRAITPTPIEVVAYDVTWPSVFESLRAELAAVLGQIALEILHVGSTAVPGLAAKPTIDIDLVIESEADFPQAIERLATIGYEFEGDFGIVGRYAFRCPPQYAAHHHHLYVCVKNNRELQRHVLFRDYLRAHPEAAREYGDLKVALACEHRDNRDAYSKAKTEWVEQALKVATQKFSDPRRD